MEPKQYQVLHVLEKLDSIDRHLEGIEKALFSIALVHGSTGALFDDEEAEGNKE